MSDSVTPWTAARQAPLSFTISQSLLKLVSIESVMLLTISSSVASLSSCPPSFPASDLFQWVGSLHQVAKVLELQVQHQSFQWIFRISFRIDWFDLAVQGTRKSILQQHSLKASILWCSAFFMVQLSHPCMTTGKAIALIKQTYVSKMMSAF